MKIVSRIEIDAPETAVWRILSDHERMTEWMDFREVVRRRPGSPDPNGVGAVRTLRASGFVIDEQITAFEPARRIDYEITEGAPVRNHRGEVTLEACTSGTLLTWTIHFDALIPGTGGLLKRAVTRSLESGLPHLKHLVESEGEAPRP